jgi:GTPase
LPKKKKTPEASSRPFRSGTASIIGLPNAGKSTLLNALVGEKVAIVSHKAQTTRTSLTGIVTTPHAQIRFVDTPGLHKSDNPFNQRMMRTVRAALQAIDVLVFVADATHSVSEEIVHAIDLVKKAGVPTVCVLNKVDRLPAKEKLLELIAAYQELHSFAAIIPISALRRDGVDALRDAIIAHLPEGPPLYPEDHFTDVPSRFLAAEIVREKILGLTSQEVPHAVAVLVDKWDETPQMTRIAATIYVERPGQKSIIVGKAGAAIKRIGTSSRIAIEEFFQKKVFLELFVKVKPGWRGDPQFLNELDWRRMAGTDAGDGDELQ